MGRSRRETHKPEMRLRDTAPIWPELESAYLQEVCDAFRAKSKSFRYRGELDVHAGVEVDGALCLKTEAFRFEQTRYYNGVPEDAFTRIEGMLVRFQPGGEPPSPLLELVIWETCVHLEIRNTTRTHLGQLLLSLEDMRIPCTPHEMVSMFSWTIEELALLQLDSAEDERNETLKRISTRWQGIQ